MTIQTLLEMWNRPEDGYPHPKWVFKSFEWFCLWHGVK